MRTTLALLTAGVLALSANVSSAQSGRLILDQAPLDTAVPISKEQLAEYYAKMGKEQIGVIRMLEGGQFNVNIRHVENQTPDKYGTEFHEDTIDVWVITEGGGTLVTGGEEVDGKHRGGVERQVKVGDVIYIPAGIYHGMKDTRLTTWLNIRFPEHRN